MAIKMWREKGEKSFVGYFMSNFFQM
jgi:hypothetical protein